GYFPGKPISLNGAWSSGVYTRFTGMPERVSERVLLSGWRSVNCFSSFRSHSSRWRLTSSAIGTFPVEIAVVDHPLRLELGARQGAFRHQLDARPHAAARLQALADGLFQRLDIVHAGRVFGADEQFVHRLRARDDDAEFAAESFDGAQGILDGGGIDVLAADDEH